MNRILFTALIALSLHSTASAQLQNSVKLTVGGNVEFKTGGFIPSLGLGASYQRDFNRLIAMEVGINYRSRTIKPFTLFQSPSDPGTTPLIREDYISTPLMAKVITPLFNLSVGVTFDYIIGWEHLNKTDFYEITSYTIVPRYHIGGIVKIGKPLELTDNLYFEPEISVNPIYKYGYIFSSISISVIYRL